MFSMHILVALSFGCVLATAILWLTPPRRRSLSRMIFCNLWLIACMVSLRTSVAHGYSLLGEIPVHVLVFAVPVALTFRLARRASASAGT